MGIAPFNGTAIAKVSWTCQAAADMIPSFQWTHREGSRDPSCLKETNPKKHDAQNGRVDMCAFPP
jgi:hypothetical protein